MAILWPVSSEFHAIINIVGETYGYFVAVSSEFHAIINIYLYAYLMFLIFMVADKDKGKEVILYVVFAALAGLALLWRGVYVGLSTG